MLSTNCSASWFFFPEGFPAGAQLPDVVGTQLGEVFTSSGGAELSLVGGPVRDLFLGRASPDLDFTTDARPDEIIAAVAGFAELRTGTSAGTSAPSVCAGGLTPWRSLPTALKPMTPARASPRCDSAPAWRTIWSAVISPVNAMALRFPSFELIDPHGRGCVTSSPNSFALPPPPRRASPPMIRCG